MSKALITERAMTHARKFVPARKHGKFECVPFASEFSQKMDNSDLQYDETQNRKSRSRGIILAFLFMLFCFGSLFMFTASSSEMGMHVRQVAQKLFEPRDLGKIKFASGELHEEETDSEAMSMIASFGLPFVFCVSKNLGEVFLVTSAGEITVKCALGGVVEKIETNNSSFLKTVTVNHGAGLKTIYSMLDNVAVKVGDKVEQNTILGISLNGEIGFVVNFKNKIVKGLEIVDGQLSFV